MAVSRVGLSDRERRVLIALLVKTIGFGKDRDAISTSQLVVATRLRERRVWSAIKRLTDLQLIGAKGGGSGKGQAATRWVNLGVLAQLPSPLAKPQAPSDDFEASPAKPTLSVEQVAFVQVDAKRLSSLAAGMEKDPDAKG
jgi:phage replication O-like protein O